MDENEIRIGDAEREDAVKRLGEHYEAGRLTADEHSERVDQALQAKTATELNALFADLPGPHQNRPADSGDGSAHAATEPSAQPGAGWQPPWAQSGSGWQPPWAQAGPGSGSGSGTGGRPPWAAASGGQWRRGSWIPRVGGIPVPLLILLGIAMIAGLACAIAGGHPPFFLLIPAAIATFIIVRRRPRNTPPNPA